MYGSVEAIQYHTTVGESKSQVLYLNLLTECKGARFLLGIIGIPLYTIRNHIDAVRCILKGVPSVQYPSYGRNHTVSGHRKGTTYHAQIAFAYQQQQSQSHHNGYFGQASREELYRFHTQTAMVDNLKSIVERTER